MPKAIKKRIPQKSDKPEEELQEKLSTLKDSLQQRRNVALKVFFGALIIIGAALIYLIYSYNAGSRADKLEREAYGIYHNKAASQTQNREEQFKKALDVFKKAYDTRNSPLSLYYIASCYYEIGQFDESLKALKDFSSRHSGEKEYLPLVYRKMATIYLRKGDTAGAKGSLDELYNLKGGVFEDFALIEYGRLLEKEGKTDEAAKKYQELITSFPESPYKDEAQVKISGKKEG